MWHNIEALNRPRTRLTTFLQLQVFTSSVCKPSNWSRHFNVDPSLRFHIHYTLLKDQHCRKNASFSSRPDGTCREQRRRESCSCPYQQRRHDVKTHEEPAAQPPVDAKTPKYSNKKGAPSQSSLNGASLPSLCSLVVRICKYLK